IILSPMILSSVLFSWRKSMQRFQLLTVLVLAITSGLAFAEPPAKERFKEPEWKSLFDGKALGNWKSTDFGGQGEVKVEKGELILETGEPLTGVTWQKKDELPRDNFEITLEAIKLKGDDFFCGLTFPVRKSHCSF